MNDLVDKIAEGKAVLLTAEQICERLSVSRSTFDRWVRNGSPLSSRDDGKNKTLSFLKDQNGDSLSIRFPPPDIRIGNSPRWSIETFKGWLERNLAS